MLRCWIHEFCEEFVVLQRKKTKSKYAIPNESHDKSTKFIIVFVFIIIWIIIIIIS